MLQQSFRANILNNCYSINVTCIRIQYISLRNLKAFTVDANMSGTRFERTDHGSIAWNNNFANTHL